MSSTAPPIPASLDGFTPDWALAVMKHWFKKNEKNLASIKINKVEPRVNTEQVCLQKNLLQYNMYCKMLSRDC